MADASELRAFDPFDIMDEESARLRAFFESRDDAGWKEPTRCEGRDVRALLAHLAGGEEYNRACLTDTIADLMKRGQDAGATDMNSFNDWGIRTRADRSAEDVIAEWREANGFFRTEMRERGRDGSLQTMVGAYPVGLQGFHLASEYATHADDMDVPVPPDRAAARLAWREAFSRFALVEAEKPAEVSREEDAYIVRAAGQEARLTPFEFVEAVTARLKTIPIELQDALRALA